MSPPAAPSRETLLHPDRCGGYLSGLISVFSTTRMIKHPAQMGDMDT